MNKLVKTLMVVIALILIFPLKTYAKDNEVNLYLFYSDTCPHCAALEDALETIEDEYPNLKVYTYEITADSKNRTLMTEAADALNVSVSGVPFVVIGTKTFVGYVEGSTIENIEKVIKVYQGVDSYKDPVGELLGVVSDTGDLTYDDIINSKQDNTSDDYTINVPFIGKVDVKDFSLPVIAVLIGTIDGFNPCAMWVLLFLISILIGMKDRKRMWILGSTFLIASALVYLFFMLAWLNLAIFIGAIWWVRMLIAAFAIIGGYLNLRSYIKTKDTGCEVVDEKKRKKIITKIQKFTSQKSFIIAMLGIIALAASVNLIELTCSAGLPIIFTNLLAINNLSSWQYGIYLFIYLFFFLLDDLVIFIIAMVSFKLTGISNKYAKYSHLIGGIIMLIIGLLMIFKPAWLSFNF